MYNVERLGVTRITSSPVLVSKLVIKTAFEHGVLVLKAGKNTLRFLPALTISKEEMNEGFKRLENALDKIKQD